MPLPVDGEGLEPEADRRVKVRIREGVDEAPPPPGHAAPRAESPRAPHKSFGSSVSGDTAGGEMMSSELSRLSRQDSQVPSSSRVSKGLSKMMESVIDDDDIASGPREDWDRLRQFCYWTLHGTFGKGSDTSVFDSVVGVLVLFNVAVMIVETDASAGCPLPSADMCVPSWVKITNTVLLAIYTWEAILRLYLYRLKFFCSKWNLLDFLIVVCGLLGLALEDVDAFKRVNILRLLRVARIIRVAKILKRFPVLMNFIGGFVGAMQAMVWGIILILMLLIMWSLMAVELIYPESLKLELAEDDICKYAFSTVFRSTLTFFQTLVAGDSWGACAIPIINQAPQTYLIFALALVTVQLGFTNLVLAVIVDSANEAREQGREERVKERKKAEEAYLEKWGDVMQSMDSDESGSISEAELLAGYRNKTVSEPLKELNIGKEDLSELFHLMDCMDTGELPYRVFIDCFRKAQQQDARVYMMFMQLRLQKVEARLTHFLDTFNREHRRRNAHHPRSPRARSPPQSPRAPVEQAAAPSDAASGGADSEALQPAPQPASPRAPPPACEEAAVEAPPAADSATAAESATVLTPRAEELCGGPPAEEPLDDDGVRRPPSPLCEELLRSLRASIDRRLSAIVAEAVDAAESAAKIKSLEQAWHVYDEAADQVDEAICDMPRRSPNVLITLQARPTWNPGLELAACAAAGAAHSSPERPRPGSLRPPGGRTVEDGGAQPSGRGPGRAGPPPAVVASGDGGGGLGAAAS